MQTKLPFTRISTAVGIAAILTGTLAGCSIGRTDVAAMVYQVSADQPSEIANTTIEFAHTIDPDKSTIPEMVAADTTSLSGKTWSDVGSIVGNETAKVVATPPHGVTASCVILRDGKDELVSQTGQPGEPVTCEVETPPREPGILKDFGKD